MNLVLAGAMQCHMAAVLCVSSCHRGWVRHGQRCQGRLSQRVNHSELRPEPSVLADGLGQELPLWGVSVVEMWLKEAK